MISIVILAAGASSRMGGRDKLMEHVSGQPVLAQVAQHAVATGWPVLVVLSAAHPARATAVQDLAARQVMLKGSTAGMAGSIRAAMGAIGPDITGVMIVPADMPDLNVECFQILATCFKDHPDAIWRGSTQDGAPGHPVIFPQRCFAKLRALPDGEGARDVLHGEDVRLCPLPGQAARTDLDTPEDWAAWRTRQD